MTWDLSVVRFAAPYRSVAEMRPDVQALDIGPCDAIRVAVSAVFVGVDWIKPAFGSYRCPSGSIEFDLGAEEPVKDFLMRVRAGPVVAPLIVELCRRNGWSALDCTSGEFLPPPNLPAAGLEPRQRYRLLENSPLGIYPPHEGYVKLEYQVGGTLIWVMCRSGDAEFDCLKRADEMLGTAFVSIPAVMALAEETSRGLFPGQWAMHDWSGIVGHRLDVWGVTLSPDKKTISYEISRNWAFDFAALGAGVSEISCEGFHTAN